jgi:outer membrane protein assembly factor BamB
MKEIRHKERTCSMNALRSLVVIAAVGLVAATVPAAAPAPSAAPAGAVKPTPDWPCWRGPYHNGITASPRKWATAWPAEGPKKLWTAKIGPGYSSMAVASGRVFAGGWGDPKVVGKPKWDSLFCVDAETGKVLWTAALPTTGENKNIGTAPTPAVGGDVVVAISNSGGVAAFDVKSGQPLWTREMEKDFKSKAPGYCWAASPMVLGDVVIIGGGAHGIGLDRKTGKTLWQSDPSTAACISPVPCEIDGEAAVVLLTGAEMSAVRPADGSVIYGSPLKEISWKVRMPLYADPIVSGRQIELGGIWLTLDGGKVKWDKPGVAGHPIIVDDVLLVFGIDGTLTLARTGPDQFQELARAVIFPGYKDGEQASHTVTAPAFADGRVYLRKVDTITCIDLRE